MSRRIDTSVLVVGAGPVGLTLAMDLAWRGIDVTIAEMRRDGEPPNVKCNQISARSMEICGRNAAPLRCAYRAEETINLDLQLVPLGRQ
jgi:2-polyprenyl-6-methoxyphenol hydroxylase-like FAD-dependent oxidoreductase